MALACWPLSRFVVRAYRISCRGAFGGFLTPLAALCVGPPPSHGAAAWLALNTQAASVKPALELEHRARGGDLKKTLELPG